MKCLTCGNEGIKISVDGQFAVCDTCGTQFVINKGALFTMNDNYTENIDSGQAPSREELLEKLNTLVKERKNIDDLIADKKAEMKSIKDAAKDKDEEIKDIVTLLEGVK